MGSAHAPTMRQRDFGNRNATSVAVFSCLLSSLVSASCGAKVIVDDGGGGSSSVPVTSTTGMTNASSAVATASSSTNDPCDMLSVALKYTYRAAQTCDPQLSVVQCSGSDVLPDACGCPNFIVNEAQPAAVTAAKNAYAAFVNAGCAPHDCTGGCTPAKAGACLQETPGATVWTCKPASPGG